MPQFRWRSCAKQWESGAIKSELFLLELKQRTQNNIFITILFLTDIPISRIRHVSKHLKPFSVPFHMNVVIYVILVGEAPGLLRNSDCTWYSADKKNLIDISVMKLTM
jgi:hypothetical protein